MHRLFTLILSALAPTLVSSNEAYCLSIEGCRENARLEKGFSGGKLRNFTPGAGEMAQSVKHLPCKM